MRTCSASIHARTRTGAVTQADIDAYPVYDENGNVIVLHVPTSAQRADMFIRGWVAPIAVFAGIEYVGYRVAGPPGLVIAIVPAFIGMFWIGVKLTGRVG